MLIKALSPFLILPLSFAMPVPDSHPTCPADKPHSIDIVNRSHYFDFAKTACQILFFPGYVGPDSRATTIYIWTAYTEGKDVFEPHKFVLSGEVGSMDSQKCEYAFTSAEAQDANKDNNYCQFDGGVGLKGWRFEREGRVYEMRIGDSVQRAGDAPPVGVDLGEYQMTKSTSWTKG